jgi:hypothetical protein
MRTIETQRGASEHEGRSFYKGPGFCGETRAYLYKTTFFNQTAHPAVLQYLFFNIIYSNFSINREKGDDLGVLHTPKPPPLTKKIHIVNILFGFKKAQGGFCHGYI